MKNGPYELVVAPPGFPGKRYRGRYAYEHTVVWWQHTGEVPGPDETIHHKNENKRDNRFDNLERKTRSRHTRDHNLQIPSGTPPPPRSIRIPIRYHPRITKVRVRSAVSPLTRFLRRVELSGDCWIWMGARDPYGRIKIEGRTVLAHRFAYTMFRGPIPDGLDLDHKCRNPECVNPKHLEPVTTGVNTARGFSPNALSARFDVCRRGHDLPAREGTEVRKCRLCRKADEVEARELFRLGLLDRPHGMPSTYQRFGCRCSACKKAYSEKRWRARRNRTCIEAM